MIDPIENDSHNFDAGKFEHDRHRVEQGFWPKLRNVARRVPFLEELLSAYYCAIDPTSPMRVKAILMAALAYFILPFDTVPDFLALIGFADDATVIYAAVKMVAKHITPIHRERARAALDKLDS